MEFPPKVTALERALALVFLLLVAALCRLESRSAAAAAVRNKTPWLCWLALKSPDEAAAPRLSLAVYQPGRRTLGLLYIPEDTRLPGGRKTLGKLYAESLRETQAPARAARAEADALKDWLLPLIPGPHGEAPAFFLDQPETLEAAEPALASKDWLLRQTQGLAFWGNLLKRLKSPRTATTISRFDRLSLALELHNLPADNIRPAWLPAEGDVESLLGRMTSAEPPPAPGRALTAEILNASGNKGIASQVTKVLRLKGVDVVTFGNLSGEGKPAERTVIYDRAGTIENALSVRALLGCPSAEAVTQINAHKLVDVSVVLAADCPN